jgi:hypothetical protein
MNLIITDMSPWQAAMNLSDFHVYRELLNVSQILSTAGDIRGLTSSHSFMPHSQEDPIVQWAAQNMHNMAWLAEYGLALSTLYRERFKFKTIAAAQVAEAWRYNKQITDILNGQDDSEQADQTVLNGTLPPIEFSEYYSNIRKYELSKSINRLSGRIIEDVDLRYYKWSAMVAASREYYAWEYATKPWCLYVAYGRPPWLTSIQKNNIKTWEMMAEKPMKYLPETEEWMVRLIQEVHPLKVVPVLRQSDESVKNVGSLPQAQVPIWHTGSVVDANLVTLWTEATPNIPTPLQDTSWME